MAASDRAELTGRLYGEVSRLLGEGELQQKPSIPRREH
jgi:hypothetical protein